MAKHTYNFVEKYDGVGAFGWDRKTDEETLKFYLQKFSDDHFMEILITKLSNEEIESIYSLINTLIQRHLSETEYHRHFLKDGSH
jgi:ferritin-like metal-binding protein YciE